MAYSFNSLPMGVLTGRRHKKKCPTHHANWQALGFSSKHSKNISLPIYFFLQSTPNSPRLTLWSFASSIIFCFASSHTSMSFRQCLTVSDVGRHHWYISLRVWHCPKPVLLLTDIVQSKFWRPKQMPADQDQGNFNEKQIQDELQLCSEPYVREVQLRRKWAMGCLNRLRHPVFSLTHKWHEKSTLDFCG